MWKGKTRRKINLFINIILNVPNEIITISFFHSIFWTLFIQKKKKQKHCFIWSREWIKWMQESKVQSFIRKEKKEKQNKNSWEHESRDTAKNSRSYFATHFEDNWMDILTRDKNCYSLYFPCGSRKLLLLLLYIYIYNC